jgi:ElaB/YqjD/DUF883 family membrane-anchored ribosome-binding protein
VPDVTFPPVDINKAAADVNNALKEGAYVAVGLGVLGFQRAQVQRVELMKQLEAQFGQLSTQLEDYTEIARSQAEVARTQIEGQLETARVQLTELAKTVDERMQPVRKQLDGQIDRLEQTLPPAARSVVESVRAAAATPEQVLRSVVGLD